MKKAIVFILLSITCIIIESAFFAEGNAMDDGKYMKIALQEGRKSFKTAAGEPCGACVVKDGQVIGIGRSTVLKDNDATCHAEINAIREASRKLGTYDLSGCAIYSTTEPYPMCFAAAHWAGIKKIAFGSSISDSRAIGFDELEISNATMISLSHSKIELTNRVLADDCRKLLKDWYDMVNNGTIKVNKDSPGFRK